MVCVTKRDDSVDLQMMKACYHAYKNGRNFPGTIKDPGVEGMTVEEFIASERRLMQKGLLSGSVTHTRAGPIYFPTSITKEGIKFVDSTQQPIIQRETQSNMIESFKLPALERISKILGEYFTGFEITGLFKKSGFPEIVHDGSTKWRFLSSTF